MPLTARINPIGNSLRVTNCDDTFEDKPLPCGCPPDPENDDGDYPPVANKSLCDYANVYARITWNILQELKLQIVENYSDTIQGWTSAASRTAYIFKMPAFFAVQVPIKLIDEDTHDNFMGTNFNLGSPQSQEIWNTVVCAFFASLTENFGELNYEDLKAKFTANGMIGYGAIATCIPKAFMNEIAYLLLTDAMNDQDYSTSSSYDCDLCEEVDPPPDEDCEECPQTQGYALKAGEVNNFTVTGATVVDFAAPNDACWFSEDDEEMLIDLGEVRCVSSVRLRVYTPCGGGGSLRSTYHRLEIDEKVVTNFACAILNTAKFAAVDVVDNATIPFYFTTPVSGRYIKIIGNKTQLTVVQVNVYLCIG